MTHGGRKEAGSSQGEQERCECWQGSFLQCSPCRDPCLPARLPPASMLSQPDHYGNSVLHSHFGHAPSHPKHHETSCSGLETIELPINRGPAR